MARFSGFDRHPSDAFKRHAITIVVLALVGVFGPALAAFDAEARQRRPKRPTVNPIPQAYMMQPGQGYWARRPVPRYAPFVENPNTEAAMRIQDSNNGSVGP